MMTWKTLATLGILALMATAAALPATPLACSDCEVQAQIVVGYVPSVQEVLDGGSVTWYTLDVGHVQADGVNGPSCFAAPQDVKVTFDIVGDKLYATQDGVTSECTNAERLPDGDFVVPYYCAVHPTMRASLVVHA